jgi:hypothetical protein
VQIFGCHWIIIKKWASGLSLWKWPLEATLCGEGHPSPTENFTSKLNLINLITFSFLYHEVSYDSEMFKNIQMANFIFL